MAKGYRLNWRGDKVQDEVLEACRRGVNKTMADCIAPAKRKTPVRTSALQGSIRIQQFAQRTRRGVAGVWGSVAIVYAIFVELGTRRYMGRRMMMNAADQEYPKLKQNIKRYLRLR